MYVMKIRYECNEVNCNRLALFVDVMDKDNIYYYCHYHAGLMEKYNDIKLPLIDPKLAAML